MIILILQCIDIELFRGYGSHNEKEAKAEAVKFHFKLADMGHVFRFVLRLAQESELVCRWYVLLIVIEYCTSDIYILI